MERAETQSRLQIGAPKKSHFPHSDVHEKKSPHTLRQEAMQRTISV